MKKIFSMLLAAIVTTGAFAQTQSMAIGTAMPLTDYNITDVFTGKRTVLKQQATDKGLLVIFTCNTCPFVIRNEFRTNEMLGLAKQKGIGVVLVNSNEAQRKDVDAPKEMMKYGRMHKYPNYMIDQGSLLADIFGASHTPEVYLFDGKDKLVYKGAMDDNPAEPHSAKVVYLKEAMNELSEGKTITTAETKSIGCSIKRAAK